MQLFRHLILWCCFLLPAACAGERSTSSRSGDVWSSMAGMEQELQGQTLELRDELIASHLAYLAALDAALIEVDGRSPEDPAHALAWARIEYLLETTYRLLDNSGEYDAFLRTTFPLKPDAVEPPASVPLPPAAPAEAEVVELDSGLVYTDRDGKSLVPEMGRNGPRLVYPASGDAPASTEGVIAQPREAAPQTERAYVPLIKARAAWLRAQAFERLGRVREAAAETKDLGLIRDWAVLGPLEGLAEDYSAVNYGLDEVYASIGRTGSFPGKSGTIRWKPLSSRDPLGRIFPGAMFRGEGLKSAYALALVHSDADQPAVMHFGSNASAVVCVNHVLASRTRYAGLPDPDQESFPVWMRRGWNVVLVRTSSVGDEWAFAGRLTRPDGTPFPGSVMTPDDSNLEAFIAEVARISRRTVLDRHYAPESALATDGVSVLSAWLEQRPGDARANFYLASFLVAKRMMEGPERFDRELIFRRAVDFSDGDPFFTLMAARSVDSDIEGPDREENLRLVLLRSVADKGSAAALADIGRLYLDVMRQPRRAGEYAEMALTVNPMSLRAGVLDYDVAVDLGWDPVARRLLERLVNRHPSAPAARLRYGRAALADGRYRTALGEFHAILGVQADNHEALDGAVVALGMLGQTSAALELLVGHIDRFPYDYPVRLKLAELYRTLGRDGDAETVINAALDLAPEDPAALAMRADLERETYAEGRGRPDEVATLPRQELDLTPPRRQPPGGWEYLYFQVEDRMEQSGTINRNVSFALRIYTERAARALRHLGMLLDSDFERSGVVRLELIQADGTRERFTPPLAGGTGGGAVQLYLPPLRPGMAVEAEVRIRRDRISFLGEYFGHIAPMTQQAPVRLSRYMFTSPKERRVFFRAVNGAPEAMVVESPDGLVTRIWEMSNLPAFNPEPFSPGQYELVPCVQVSSFGDWDEFARWYWRLIGVQYHAPPELRLLANRLGAGETVALNKLDSAAAWVAKTIGSRPWEYGPYAFRPINARSILSRLSADSKDRTLLLCLFAREFGLDAWPVLARLRNASPTGTGQGDPGLPLLDHFNYSLALVHSTLGGDVFLDAANPYRPPGVMPSRLFGSPGIAVTPTGHRKITIPDGGVAACEWMEEAELVVDEDGSIIWQEEVVGAGTAAEMLRRHFRNADEAEDAWTDFLISMGGDPSVAQGEFRDGDVHPAQAEWSGRARLRRHATVADNRVILGVPTLPAPLSSSTLRLGYPLGLDEYSRLGERTQDLVLPYGFRIARSITVRYPAGWKLVNPGESFSKTYPFGTLNVRCDYRDGEMVVEFSVEVPGHVIAAADFAAFREMAALAARWIRPELVWEVE